MENLLNLINDITSLDEFYKEIENARKTNEIIKKRIFIQNQTFNSSVELVLISFESSQIIFKNCIFNKPFSFNDVKGLEIIFSECIFENTLFILDTEFTKKFIFQKCTLKKEFFIENLKSQSCIISAIKVYTIFFINQKTLEETSFYDIRFINDSQKEISFNEYFKNIKNFINDKDNNKKSSMLFETRETFNSLKYYFQNKNNYIEANKFYALEMLFFKEEMKFLPKNNEYFFQKMIFFFNQYTSNFGQNIPLSFFWIITISFLSLLIGRNYFFFIFFPFYLGGLEFSNISFLGFMLLFLKGISLILWWNLGKAVKKNIKW